MTDQPKTMTFEQIETLSGIGLVVDAGQVKITKMTVHPYSGVLTADNGRDTQLMIAPDGHITYATNALHGVAEAVNELWPWPRAVDEGRPADKVA